MRLVEYWWTVTWRSASNWVTLAVNTIGAHALVFLAVLPFAPLYVQFPLAITIALVASAPSWWARAVRQPKLQASIEEKRDADNAD
jgi:hypothetical protein